MNGQGLYTFANGNRYDGDWLDDKRTGFGIYTYINGNAYEGMFIDIGSFLQKLASIISILSKNLFLLLNHCVSILSKNH